MVRILGLRTRAEAQYRASLVTLLVSQALVGAADLVALWGLFSRVDVLGGWRADEVLFFYAVSAVGFGVADTFISPVEYCDQYVRKGTFDQFMVRPAGLLSQVCTYGFEFRRAGTLVTGPVALALWLARTDLSWTAARVAFVVVTLVAAVCSFGALLVATNAITFWIVSSREIANAFTYGGLAGATYPSHLLVSWLRRLFLFALPIGAVAYLSGLWLLDAANPMGIPRWVQAAAPLHAVLAVGLAAVVWRAATRRYQSTGS